LEAAYEAQLKAPNCIDSATAVWEVNKNCQEKKKPVKKREF
jgi:hypothetical protein